MEHAALLDAWQREGMAFADSCAAAGLEAPVDACPGWDVADLVWHLTRAHRFWETVVRTAMLSPDGYAPAERPPDEALLEVYRSTLSDTVRTLTEADPAAIVWTWARDRTTAFVVRRLTHETAIHRCDADAAAGREPSLDAHLASDGIDEFVEHFLGRSAPEADAVGGSVHIHCSDVAGEWTIRRDETGGFVTSRAHAKGDCALRGPASDLLLVLWRRRPLSVLDVVGDGEVAARFVALTPLTGRPL